MPNFHFLVDMTVYDQADEEVAKRILLRALMGNDFFTER